MVKIIAQAPKRAGEVLDHRPVQRHPALARELQQMHRSLCGSSNDPLFGGGDGCHSCVVRNWRQVCPPLTPKESNPESRTARVSGSTATAVTQAPNGPRARGSC